MPTKNAIRKAREKYEQNVSQVAAKIDKQIYAKMLQYCEEKSITKKHFLETAIMTYIDNN